MDKNTRKAIIALIGAREDLVVSRLKTNPEFQELVKKQEISGEIVEKLYECFSDAERLTIQRHYENEIGKEILENTEIYIQGLRDCFALFDFLNGKEVQL